MNFQEITAKLKELNVSTRKLAQDAAYDNDLEAVFGPIKTEASYGGEGKGEDWFVVLNFVDHGVFIRVDGWYTSYDGTDFNKDPYEVVPRKKTITVYEAE
jgi:hypothetical protein